MAQFHVAGYSLGARVGLELATRGRTSSVIAIAPDGLGMPLERLHQAAALLTGRTLATLLAPIATKVTASPVGRSLFFAMERSRPWQLPSADARQLLLNFADAPGYLETVRATMVDVQTRLERITCPGPSSPEDRRPVSADDPQLVASQMVAFLKTATRQTGTRARAVGTRSAPHWAAGHPGRRPSSPGRTVSG